MLLFAAYIHWVVSATGVAFVVAGLAISAIGIIAIRRGEFTTYQGFTVQHTLRDDPFFFTLFVGFAMLAACVCFYLAVLIFTAQPPAPNNNPTITELAE